MDRVIRSILHRLQAALDLHPLLQYSWHAFAAATTSPLYFTWMDGCLCSAARNTQVPVNQETGAPVHDDILYDSDILHKSKQRILLHTRMQTPVVRIVSAEKFDRVLVTRIHNAICPTHSSDSMSGFVRVVKHIVAANGHSPAERTQKSSASIDNLRCTRSF